MQNFHSINDCPGITLACLAKDEFHRQGLGKALQNLLSAVCAAVLADHKSQRYLRRQLSVDLANGGFNAAGFIVHRQQDFEFRGRVQHTVRLE